MTMRKTVRATVALLLAIFIAGCSSATFIISKNNKAYYFGRDSKVLHAMLCDSGELKEILSETTIEEDIRHELYRYNCTDEHSTEKVISIYTFLTPEEKKQLQNAFRDHDYRINYVPC